MMRKGIKVLPTAWELRRGLLRRTPALRLLEREGVIAGNGWMLRASGEWYEAVDFYERLGLRESPLPILLVPLGHGEALAEVLPVPAKRPLSAPKEEPPPPEERPKKRVRVGERREEDPLPPPREEALGFQPGEEEGPRLRPAMPSASSPLPTSFPLRKTEEIPESKAPPASKGGEAPVPLREVHTLLWEILGGEEFGRYSVDPYLRHRGYDPEAVWRALSQAGCLEERGGFWRLLPPSPSRPSAPLKRVVIEETHDLPSYLRPQEASRS